MFMLDPFHFISFWNVRSLYILIFFEKIIMKRML